MKAVGKPIEGHSEIYVKGFFVNENMLLTKTADEYKYWNID